jgi:hypothetical protein
MEITARGWQCGLMAQWDQSEPQWDQSKRSVARRLAEPASEPRYATPRRHKAPDRPGRLTCPATLPRASGGMPAVAVTGRSGRLATTARTKRRGWGYRTFLSATHATTSGLIWRIFSRGKAPGFQV